MHVIVRMDFANVPAWLDEGMTMLYECSMWRSDALLPLPNWRVDRISDVDDLDLARFADMGGRDELGHYDLSAFRMLMLYSESANRLKAFYHSVREDPDLRELGAAVASLAIDPAEWRSFVSTSYGQYLADEHRDGTWPTNPYEIKFIQVGLNRQLGTDLSVDGHWGPNTRLQVEAFQEQAGLDVDGRVGPDTMQQIKLTLTGLESTD